MGVTRRGVLSGGLSIGLAGISAGCLGTGGLNGAVGDVLSTPDPNAMEQDLGAGFDRLVWQDSGDAKVYFDPRHKMNGFYILHEYESDPMSGLASCSAPKFAGPMTVPLIDLIQSSRIDYPTRQFKFIGAKGMFSGCPRTSSLIPIETYGVAHFTIPEQFDI